MFPTVNVVDIVTTISLRRGAEKASEGKILKYRLVFGCASGSYACGELPADPHL